MKDKTDKNPEEELRKLVGDEVTEAYVNLSRHIKYCVEHDLPDNTVTRLYLDARLDKIEKMIESLIKQKSK